MKLYLIRHAESESNVSKDNLIAGHDLDTKLTDNGKKQATALGERFRDEKFIIDMVITSTAKRAMETASIALNIMQYVGPIFATSDVLEQDPGDFAGQNRRHIYGERKDVRQALDEDNWRFIPGDHTKGESQEMVAKRMSKFIHKYVTEDSCKNVAIFTHGNAIKFLLAELLNLERSTAYKTGIPNTNIACLEFIDQKLSSCIWTL